MGEGAFEIFLVTAPGLETALVEEAREKGFEVAGSILGGVTVTGGWPEVWRANLELRGAVRVLARVAEFRALHLAQLDKRARKVPWAAILRPDVPFKVEASCKKSRIYHQGAAAQRVKTAIKDALGAKVDDEAPITVKARIDDDLCTISVDTSGESLHKRGHKAEVAKAPMRETMAALFLRQCGYRGTEPVVDPMCGSGTFVIEAAEIAAGLKPGRSRQFAFEQLASFDPAAWQKLRADPRPQTGGGLGRGKLQSSWQESSLASPTPALPQFGGGVTRFYGSDRDAGAIRMSRANAERAGVTALTEFREHAVSDLKPPEGPPGLVIVNPPYGGRIGEKQSLHPLYRALGQTLLARFGGWRVGIVTNEASLAEATGLSFAPPGPPVTHGGLRVVLYQAGPLPRV